MDTFYDCAYCIQCIGSWSPSAVTQDCVCVCVCVCVVCVCCVCVLCVCVVCVLCVVCVCVCVLTTDQCCPVVHTGRTRCLSSLWHCLVSIHLGTQVGPWWVLSATPGSVCVCVVGASVHTHEVWGIHTCTCIQYVIRTQLFSMQASLIWCAKRAIQRWRHLSETKQARRQCFNFQWHGWKIWLRWVVYSNTLLLRAFNAP